MRRILLLIFALCASNAFAQTTPAVPRPAQFHYGIRVIPGVRPTDPYEGHVYQDSTTHKIYVYNGSAWVELGALSDTGTSGQVLTSQGTGTPVWADVSGSGVPGGSAGTVQYKNGGNFGGTNLTYASSKFTSAFISNATGAWVKNVPASGDTTAGNFEVYIGEATNDVAPGDTRPDHVAAFGWNASSAASGNAANGTGIGKSTLVFESYCSFGTGCLAGNGGQSETYFDMSDGKGSEVRPLGFFQGKFQDDTSHYLSAIARADTWSFFNADQTTQLFAISATSGLALNTSFNVTLASADGDWLYQHGHSLIRSDAGGVAVGPNDSLLLGATGEHTVTVEGNHFALSATTIEDTSGNNRLKLGAGSATNYPSLGASGTDDIILKPLGSTTNVQMTIESKGSGAVYLHPGTGDLKINGGTGVTASGSSCTITAITKGIITGATCTP